MSWIIRRPYRFHSELKELATNRNYVQHAIRYGRTVVSSGEILVRAKQCSRYPVLIVFPDATPYVPPQVYLLKEVIPTEVVQELSGLPPYAIPDRIKGYVHFYYHRHQGSDGSLCIVETDDLHNDSPELYTVRAVIKRTRDWLWGTQTGKFPPDSREVELFYHFPNQCDDLIFILPDEFFRSELLRGRFYFARIKGITDNHYFGLAVEGPSAKGVHQFFGVKRERGYFFEIKENDFPDIVDFTARNEKALELINAGTVIEGSWWQIKEEPKPFATVQELGRYIESAKGLEMLAIELNKKLKRNEDGYVGLRFPNRRAELEWQFFRLPKVANEGAILGEFALEDALARLTSREVQAIKAELFTEEYYHLRNSTRADRAKLKDKSVTVIGVGTLGSPVAENLAKAGIGKICLVDKGILKGHNCVRHTCGLFFSDWPKCKAVAVNSVAMHNPFVKVAIQPVNILLKSIDDYFDPLSVGISTIADDNVEGFLNEESVRSGRTVYYARALRGGKAARIFRVKPGVDACKECLIHYKLEGYGRFVDISEDDSLPPLTNECNNPVRPGSGADMNVIAGIFSRIIIDDLQGSGDGCNHWIWHTENLAGLPVSNDQWGSVYRQFIPPHPKCRLCQRIEIKPVLILDEAIQVMRREAASSGKVETGGVLIGFRNTAGHIIVVKATGPGPKAIRTETRFEKDIEYCQGQLEQAARSLSFKGQYVGEWHYHPVGTNGPSPTDVASLTAIARQPNYTTDEPLLVILSPQLEMAFTVHPAHKGYVATSFTVVRPEDVDKMECQLA